MKSIAGVRAAVNEGAEADWINRSPSGQQFIRMLRASNRPTSIKSVAADGELFNSAFWATRPYRGSDRHLEKPCLALAERLTTDKCNSALRTLTSRPRVDA